MGLGGESLAGVMPHFPASEMEAKASSLYPRLGVGIVAASPPPPALPHSTPGQVREFMEGREGTERPLGLPGSSPTPGPGAAQRLHVFSSCCDEQCGGSCVSGGGKKVVLVWLKSRGSGKGSGACRNWCLGLVNLACG